MSEGDNQKKPERRKVSKEITIGESIGLSDSVTVIKIRGEANKELDSLPKGEREKVLEDAIELSKKHGHPFDVQLEDVVEAKKTRGKQS